MKSASEPGRLEFFWDVSSPYTYLAHTQVDALIARTGASLIHRPFLLGGVFKATGNAAPAAVLAKGVYMAKDLERWRDHYGVPMLMPLSEVTFPINSVLPMRVATAMSRRGLGKEVCTALMTAYWVKGQDVSDAAVVRAVVSAMGADADAVLEEAVSPEVKDELRATSDEAVSRGAFGAPTFVVGDQIFFGNDRLHFVEAALRG